MKQLFSNQQVDCYLQEGSVVSESASLVGSLTKTPDGFRFEQEVRTVKPYTRNPKIYEEKHISLVRRADNSLKFSFKEMKPHTDLNQYAFEVFCEIQRAVLFIQSSHAAIQQ